MRDIIDRLRNDEPKFRLNSDAAHEIERLRADLADCRRLLGKYSDTAQELRGACDEKQRCIDSSVAAQREFLAVIDRLRAELAEAKRDKHAALEALSDMVFQFFMEDGDLLFHSFMGTEEHAMSVLIAQGRAEEVRRNRYRLVDAAMAGGEHGDA